MAKAEKKAAAETAKADRSVTAAAKKRKPSQQASKPKPPPKQAKKAAAKKPAAAAKKSKQPPKRKKTQVEQQRPDPQDLYKRRTVRVAKQLVCKCGNCGRFPTCGGLAY